MDLLVNVGRPSEQELASPPVTSSPDARQVVSEARERQRARLAGAPARCNGELDSRSVRRYVQLDPAAERVIARAYAAGSLSARGRDRVLRVARTIADLEGRGQVGSDDVLAALSLRQRTSSEEETGWAQAASG
jgi:magnesium chelatase family protein